MKPMKAGTTKSTNNMSLTYDLIMIALAAGHSVTAMHSVQKEIVSVAFVEFGQVHVYPNLTLGGPGNEVLEPAKLIQVEFRHRDESDHPDGWKPISQLQTVKNT